MVEIIGRPLGWLLGGCYSLLGNYGLAIVLFTLLTKVILFPVSMWTHRNGLKMVSMMPELNRLKIQYYGDKDTVAEKTQELYHREHYHPLASTAPMIVQLVLLMGVIGAVRNVLTGTESILSAYPSHSGGISFLMPLVAGLAALILGLAQNHLNPLQREQSKAGQWMTNGLSIGISLFLGAFVPIGVGIYWIASNLLTIGQQIVLNTVLPPEKYVDYEALEASKQELAGIESLSSQVSKEDKRREKADYKRFFSVANKHLVFYSESNGFYKYFKDVIEYLLEHSNVIIHYVTSDPKDQIFERAKTQPRIRPYYIGEKRLITLFMKMDADMVVMTMPDLDNYHIKRSYVRKDVEYVYMFHGVITSLRTLRPNALDHYDTVLTAGDFQEREIRALEQATGVPPKELVPCGYGVVDSMARAYEEMDIQTTEIPHVLIAPSWQQDNILESCLIPLVSKLLQAGYDVTVRPHPQYLKRFPQKFEEIVQRCQPFSSQSFRFETDFSSNETVFTADLLVTDWSGIGYEYALATLKPVLFIDTLMKVVNPYMTEAEQKEPPFDLRMRSKMGIALKPEEVESCAGEAVQKMFQKKQEYAQVIAQIRQEHIYHFGESGKYGGQYILSQLQKSKGKRKQ